MGEVETRGPQDPALRRLLGFVALDPDNLPLLRDAATTALACGDLVSARQLIDRYALTAALPADLLNIRGLVSLSSGQFNEAGDDFATLLQAHPADPGLRFNLAWCKAMLGDFAATERLIDESVFAAAPQAAALKIQSLHHLGQLEEGLSLGEALARLRPDDARLMGALSVLAVDADRIDLAKTYAEQAQGDPDGLATLGMLRLNDNRADESLAYFDRAIEASARNPRALLGKGLALMVKGDASGGAAYIDQGAEVFGDHAGSWAAAGWAHFVEGDYPGARARFETALTFDEDLAEAEGGLAILDIVAKDIESARQRTATALRLDPDCFSATLAKSLLVSHDGDAQSAEQVRQIALNLPLGPGGLTVAQAMVGMGVRGGIRPGKP